MSSDVELYEILDKLILQAENTESHSSENLENLQNLIENWPQEKIKEMAGLCNTVLTDLDTQYNLIENKIHDEQKHSRRRHISNLEETATELEQESQKLAERESSLQLSLNQLEIDVKKKEKELLDIEQQLNRQTAIEENFTSEYFDLKLEYIERITKVGVLVVNSQKLLNPFNPLKLHIVCCKVAYVYLLLIFSSFPAQPIPKTHNIGIIATCMNAL